MCCGFYIVLLHKQQKYQRQNHSQMDEHSFHCGLRLRTGGDDVLATSKEVDILGRDKRAHPHSFFGLAADSMAYGRQVVAHPSDRDSRACCCYLRPQTVTWPEYLAPVRAHSRVSSALQPCIAELHPNNIGSFKFFLSTLPSFHRKDFFFYVTFLFSCFYASTTTARL